MFYEDVYCARDLIVIAKTTAKGWIEMGKPATDGETGEAIYSYFLQIAEPYLQSAYQYNYHNCVFFFCFISKAVSITIALYA